MHRIDSPSFRKQLLLTSLIAITVLLLDQWLKFYVKTDFDPYEPARPLFGDWLVLEYIENPGMAFGTTFGTSIWGKLALSIFRILAIGGMIYYWITRTRKGVKWDFHLATALVFAGAAGNLIDSMFYDFWFEYDPCMRFNIMPGSGNEIDCGHFIQETKFRGFLLGNVVDMFKFQGSWPEWMPWLGGKDVFPAIWNLADGSITVGVIIIFFRQKSFFPSKKPA